MDAQVLHTVQQLHAEDFPQGAVLYHEGEAPSDVMYFVFEGEIGVFKNREGQEHEINRLGPGDFFGEMALVYERPRLATVRVISPVARLVVINREAMLKLAGTSPEFLFYLLRYAVGRLLAAEDKLQRVREELRFKKPQREK